MQPNDKIQQLTAEAADLLKGMVAIKSPSFSEEDVCTYICNWLSGKGIVHKRIGNNITARLSEQKGIPMKGFQDKPVLMLCAHIDTVSPSEDYSFDPYVPDYEKAAECINRKISNGEIPESPKPMIAADDIVAGLGSNDDGASVVSMLAAFRYFMQSPVMDILLVLTCEEERSGLNGMTGLWGTVLNGKDADSILVNYAVVGEPTLMKAATSERGLLVIDATAHGVSGHAARNEGVNAIEVALKDISALKEHVFEKISPRMGKVNLNVTQINAGTAHNVIPDICTFVIDIRPTEQYTNEEILDELQKICASQLKARNLSNRSSAAAEDSPLQRAAESLGIETFSSPTTSDWMRINCDAIKMGPGNSSRSHKKDEFVFISEIEQGITTYIDFIKSL